MAVVLLEEELEMSLTKEKSGDGFGDDGGQDDGGMLIGGQAKSFASWIGSWYQGSCRERMRCIRVVIECVLRLKELVTTPQVLTGHEYWASVDGSS